MEFHLQPALAAKVQEWSAQTGRPAGEAVEEALAGYFSELDELRSTLDQRYDDIASGKIEPVEGEEAFRLLRERAAARQKSIA